MKISIRTRDDKQGDKVCEYETGVCDDEVVYCGEPATHKVGRKYACEYHARYVAELTGSKIDGWG